MRVGRRAIAARKDTGAAAVEFAIIVPVLLLLVLGMLEFSLYMRDYLAVSSSVRVGARIAATGPDSGTVTDCSGLDACHVGDPVFVDAAARAIARAGTAMPQDYINEIWVYQANKSGFPTNSVPSAGNGWDNNADGATTLATALPAGCTTSCVKYVWDDTNDRFVWAGGSWNPALINACYNDPKGQAVGVYMNASHPLLTTLFGTSIGIQDRTVMLFEPMDPSVCLPEGAT
ncbi:MAG: pilus assembly protein [Actinobacteria bacterium]|nr:pilus assembly protein [Actinomycetota bacterium]